MVLTCQSRNVLLQLGEGRGLVRLERRGLISARLLIFIELRAFRTRRGGVLLTLGGKKGALQSNGMQRAGVRVHLFGPTGHQVCAVTRVQIGFWMGGGIGGRVRGVKKFNY